MGLYLCCPLLPYGCVASTAQLYLAFLCCVMCRYFENLKIIWPIWNVPLLSHRNGDVINKNILKINDLILTPSLKRRFNLFAFKFISTLLILPLSYSVYFLHKDCFFSNSDHSGGCSEQFTIRCLSHTHMTSHAYRRSGIQNFLCCLTDFEQHVFHMTVVAVRGLLIWMEASKVMFLQPPVSWHYPSSKFRWDCLLP